MSDILIAEKNPKTIYSKNYQPPQFNIESTHLLFDLYEDHALVEATLRISRIGNNNEPLELMGEELLLVDATLNGQKLADSHFVVDGDVLTVYKVPDLFELKTIIKIQPQLNTALSGLYRSGDIFCTQCEAEGFRRITYYLDRPDVLSKFTTTIIADKTKYPLLLSNGNLVEQQDLPDGRHKVVWDDPFKKPSYLFALVAGDLDVVSDTYTYPSGKKVELKCYVDKGLADQAHHAVYSLKEAMRWDDETYGREYDLDTYMIVAIGDFNMGAMENKGLNIFNTKYVLAKPDTATDIDYINILSVVGHEYFHNWTGNRVTCRDWFQLSLKEGLTIFRDQSFSEDVLGTAVMRIRDVKDLRESQFPEDAGPLAHPVLPDSYIEINNFYTATIYNKGAELLRMMQTILGKDQFRKGMDLYFKTYDGQAVTIEDFVQCMEKVSGISLKQFRRWYHQAGTPVVSVKSNYAAQSKKYTLTLSQHTDPTPEQPTKEPLDIPIRIGLLTAKGEIVPLRSDAISGDEAVIHLTEPSQIYQFENVDEKPVLSILRGFSAPIKLEIDYTEDELVLLANKDEDAFNRWEALQRYFMRVIKQLVTDRQSNAELKCPDKLISCVRDLLVEKDADKFLLSEMLVVPSEKYIGQMYDVVPVDEIHAAREFLIKSLTESLQEELKSRYSDLAQYSSTQFDTQAIAARQLKYVLLSYLGKLNKYYDLAVKQYESSLGVDMSDAMSALSVLVNSDYAGRDDILKSFHQKWQHDDLVLDKWFAVQATCSRLDTVSQVKALLDHPDFDIKNPNKVYSLIGAFGYRNVVNFHAASGEGYRLLADTVMQLDKLNPQVAARMVQPLTNWRRYDKDRQQLMRAQLERLLKVQPISADLYELVSKSL